MIKRLTFISSLAFTLVVAVATAAAAQDGAYFTDITDDVGLKFEHDPGVEGFYWAPEVMGSGGAFLDFDDDGDLDIYLLQGGFLPESKNENRKPNQLFRQNADGSFTDVTASSGLGHTGYGTGVAVGDIDNDGLVDIYVANYGPDALFRNQGGGKFGNVTKTAGIEDDAWSASAGFCDYDADGFLDIFVTRYLINDATKKCVSDSGAMDYCSPQSFNRHHPDTLYHNDGDGTFTDVSESSGIASVAQPGLGVLCHDFNVDGLMDFYVANDGEANRLWQNMGNGKFEDQAILMGAALNAFGRPEASMGVTLGDVDGDADFDLFMTHLIDQTNTLYLNDGTWGFEDVSSARGLGASSLEFTGFGTSFIDLDLDGDLDLAVVNGRVDQGAPLPGANVGDFWNMYAEPNFLYENDGRGQFTDISPKGGRFTALVEASRGLVLGDIDRDGDFDFLVTNSGSAARLFRNDAPRQGNYLMVTTYDPRYNRVAHGTVVTVNAGGESYARISDPAYSYLSSNEAKAHFGIASRTKVDSIRVRWPDGSEEMFPGVELNQSITLEKGKGRKAPTP
jgi:hypothetical protein